MKKLLLALGIAGLIMSCTPQNEQGTLISILEDITDSTLVKFDPNDVVDKFEQGGDWQKRMYRHQCITDSDYNPIYEVSLDAASEFLGNHLDREEEVSAFKQDVLEGRCEDSITVFEHSSIWTPLWNEVALASTDTTNEVLIYCLSDLKEHTHWVSLYDVSTIRMLKEDSEDLEGLFFDRLPDIGRADHISLTIVHQPGNDDNEVFNLIIEKLYRPACEQFGITLKVTANI